MDMITLAMAKKYTDEKAGYVEPGKVFTYNGREDVKFEDVGGIRTVVLSEDVFDLTKVKKIKCVITNNGQILEFEKSELTLVAGDGITSLNATYGSSTLPAVFASEHGGLLGYAQKGVGYLSDIEFEETVHTIDPKFIRTEIDLDSYGINIANVVMSSGGKLEIENTKEMWETINAKRNVVMTCALGDDKFTLYPSVVGEAHGLAHMVSMQLVAAMGGDVMITANIVLAAGTGEAGYYGDTSLYATVNQTALS